MARGDPVLRFRFRTNNQTKVSVNESVRSMAKDFASILVNQVVISASNKAFANAKRTLTNNVRAAVSREVVQLTYMVGRFLVQPDGATGPNGEISAFDPVASEHARKLGRGFYGDLSRYSLKNSGVNWRPRTNQYLMWRAKQGVMHDNWWDYTGDLHEAVSKTNFYYENFGPISVQFVRNTEATPGRDVTLTGRGRTSATAHVGTIIVNVLGRITPEMLPALAAGKPDNGATPTGRNHIGRLVADDDIRAKLEGNKSYRPILEPFLAYYLTRAIPNAVFRQTERLVETSAGANFLNPKSGATLAAFSGGGAG